MLQFTPAWRQRWLSTTRASLRNDLLWRSKFRGNGVHKLKICGIPLVARKPDECARTCFICSGRYVWSLSCSERFPPLLDLVGPITTIYLILTGFDTLIDRRASPVHIWGKMSNNILHLMGSLNANNHHDLDSYDVLQCQRS